MDMEDVDDPYEEGKKKTKRYKKIKSLLQMIYHYPSFKPKQYQIINKIISGEDVCAILPTGYGKSLTFQIPAIYMNKPAIIVTPLISLMNDQKMSLKKLKIKVCCYNSTVEDKTQMRSDIFKGKYKLIYVAPETIINMKNFLLKMDEKLGISLIAIDEAHCISSFGHDFRTSYRKLTFFKEILPHIPILAITATATPLIGKDICNVLKLKDTEPIKTSFNRPNLYLEVRQKKKGYADLLLLVKKHCKEFMIIYCLTKKETEKIENKLSQEGYNVGIYHAGLSTKKRESNHRKFMNGRLKIMVATIAFGMGINKTNIHVIIHYGCPKSIEGYYQEIGRAGRDGKDSYCYLLFHTMDFIIQKHLISKSNDASYQETQLQLLKKMENYIHANECRRKILLAYFGETLKKNCHNCDICISPEEETHKEVQEINKETKLLIDTIESIKNRSFGSMTYINLLRGSKNKFMTVTMKQNRHYGLGKHKSVQWWKELIENLIKKGFLQYSYLKGNNILMQILRVTKKGLEWSHNITLKNIIRDSVTEKLEPIRMSCQE
jgi:ATP-dependent DNA helicase RecQ